MNTYILFLTAILSCLFQQTRAASSSAEPLPLASLTSAMSAALVLCYEDNTGEQWIKDRNYAYSNLANILEDPQATRARVAQQYASERGFFYEQLRQCTEGIFAAAGQGAFVEAFSNVVGIFATNPITRSAFEADVTLARDVIHFFEQVQSGNPQPSPWFDPKIVKDSVRRVIKKLNERSAFNVTVGLETKLRAYSSMVPELTPGKSIIEIADRVRIQQK